MLKFSKFEHWISHIVCLLHSTYTVLLSSFTATLSNSMTLYLALAIDNITLALYALSYNNIMATHLHTSSIAHTYVFIASQTKKQSKTVVLYCGASTL